MNKTRCLLFTAGIVLAMAFTFSCSSDGTSGFFDRYQSPTAGRYLKAASGWNNNGNGTDEFGFSALPGGIGVLGNWWIANNRVESGTSTDIIWDFYQYMQYDEEYTNSSIQRKYDLLSVRCMQD